MTPSDVTQILVRLGVIENKLDTQAVDSSRVRRLEITVAGLLVAFGMAGANAAGVPLPFS